MEYHDTPSSKTICRIGYDSTIGTLEIEFNSGAAYEYYDVPQHVFDELMAAESTGKYANANIYKVYKQQKIR